MTADRRQALLDLGLLCLIFIACILIADPRGDFAIDDDWVYGLSVAAALRDHGAFSLPSPSSANVLLQTYWGALFCLPFGFSFFALRLSTLVLGLGGVLAAYGSAREMRVGRGLAIVAALSLALDPIYVMLSNSFMTDVPFVALVSLSLWLFARGMMRGSGPSLALAFLIAFASIAIRQFGLLLVFGFGLALIVRDRGGRRAIALTIATTALGLAGHLLFQHWLKLDHRTPVVVVASVHDAVPILNRGMAVLMLQRSFFLLPYLGIMLAPAYLATGFRSFADAVRAHPKTIAALALLFVLAEFWGDGALSTRAGIVHAWGFGPLALHDSYFLNLNMPPVPPLAALLWPAIFFLGKLCGAAILVEICAATFDWKPRPDRAPVPPGIVAALIAITLIYCAIVLLMTGIRAFDRYMLVLLPVLILWIVARAGRLGASAWRAGAGALLALYALFGTIAAHDYLAFQRARLSATTWLEAHHVPATQIDGGYEYNGRYIYDAAYVEKPGRSFWWVVDDRIMVGSGPVPGYAIIARFPYRRWLNGANADVVVLRRNQP